MIGDYLKIIKRNDELALDVAEEKKALKDEKQLKMQNLGKLVNQKKEVDNYDGFDYYKRNPHKLDF